MIKNCCLYIILVLLSTSCAVSGGIEPTHTQKPVEAVEPTPTSMLVDVIKTLSYADDIRHKLDVYLPSTGQAPYPTVLAIHGGGFRWRSKELYQNIGPYFARQGYAFVAINYRLAPLFSYPAQVEDSFCALAWLHANHEEYGFDPSRVVVMGGSAGGYLASMLSAVDNPQIYLENCPNPFPDGEAVHAAVIFYGFYDFTNVDDYPLISFGSLEPFWGGRHEELSSQQLVEMSPITHIDGSEPPFIILHGTADTSIPSVMSERFAKSLEQAGVDVELVLLPDVNHAFELRPLTGEEMTLSLNRIENFLDRVLAP